MPKINFVVENLQVEVTPGRKVRAVALENGIYVNREWVKGVNCGGRGLCGTCNVWIKAPEGAVSPPNLREKLHGMGVGRRLACQTEVRGDIEVTTMPGGDDRLDRGRKIDPPKTKNPRTNANAPKPEPKAEAKPEPKAEAKAEPKAEAKAEPKAEAKAEPKAEAKAEPKAEAKAEPKAEAKAEPKAEAKAEPKAEAKAEPKAEAKEEPAEVQKSGDSAPGDKGAPPAAAQASSEASST